MKQCTIKESVELEGIGLHTGKNVKVILKPAPANHGIKFQRIDLEPKAIIPADANKVSSTRRSTTLKSGDATIGLVEHILSALTGLQIDNVLIEVDGPEIPIMDGSAKYFVEAIQRAGIEEQDEERVYLVIDKPISYSDPETGAELLVLPSEEFQVTATIDFNSPVLGPQFARLNSLNDYVQEVSSCRTFVFVHELEQLLDAGLIKGGDLDNAIVIANKPVSEETLKRIGEKTGRKDVKVESEGVLNTTDLSFVNEPARHKTLDIVGDLRLAGAFIKGRVVAHKPGHTANVQLAKLLKKAFQKQQKLKGKPHYDENTPSVLNINEIEARLPHRFPFLLVDKVVELTDTKVVGIKNVTMNEWFFQGHFPKNPVFPGVLQIEALAQTGGLLALNTVPDPENWDTYFLKIDKTKFKQKVLPGDTLILKMELLAPIRRGICQMYGTTYVGDKIVSEGELTAQIVRRKIEE